MEEAERVAQVDNEQQQVKGDDREGGRDGDARDVAELVVGHQEADRGHEEEADTEVVEQDVERGERALPR